MLLCLYGTSFLFLSHLVTPYTEVLRLIKINVAFQQPDDVDPVQEASDCAVRPNVARTGERSQYTEQQTWLHASARLLLLMTIGRRAYMPSYMPMPTPLASEKNTYPFEMLYV